MRRLFWLVSLTIPLLLASCQGSGTVPVVILDGEQVYQLETSERIPANLIAALGISLAEDDRLIYLGEPVEPDSPLPDAQSYTIRVRRAVTVTVTTPEAGSRDVETAAFSVGQLLEELDIPVQIADRVDPPLETPLVEGLQISYQPARDLIVTVGGNQVTVRSSEETVGQALAEAGIPVVGLDYSIPSEYEPIPVNGRIRVVRVVEDVILTQKSIPFETRTELSAELELDQQELLQGGEPGLAITRTRVRYEDGVEVARETEGESIVRPPQDRIMGIGSNIVIRTTIVNGETIEYWRALRVYLTSYSPCRSASPDGRCLYGTSSGMQVQKGVVAMVYSWYIAFGFERLYIPGYGFAVVGDVGGGAPPGNHFWVDLGWTDEEFQWMGGYWETIYFLTPVPSNPVYVLP
ncbi:MAG: G5 domain-containing protein [Chloroflexota bacterium]